jgi:hypothetical protein
MAMALSLTFVAVGQNGTDVVVTGVVVSEGHVEELDRFRRPVRYAAMKPKPDGEGSKPVNTARALAEPSISSLSGRTPRYWST